MLLYFKMAYLWYWMSNLTSEKGKIYQNSMRECDVIFLSGHDHQDEDLFLLNWICVNVMFYFYQMVIEILRLIQRSFLLKPILRVCWCLTLYFTCQWSQLGYLAVSFFRSVQNACLKPPQQRRNVLRLSQESLVFGYIDDDLFDCNGFVWMWCCISCWMKTKFLIGKSSPRKVWLNVSEIKSSQYLIQS